MIKDAIAKLVEKQDLIFGEAEASMNEIMSGEATQAQIGSFLTALRMKGETIDEIAACAKVMREKASRIKPKNQDQLVDVVGTGGDKSGTFNISTTTMFVVAGAEVPVAKHGNKSVSSKSGAADVLDALGVKIDLEPKQVEQCISETGIGFMFAPKFHGAMKHAIGPRKEMGIRTIFNILGPLTNPAEAPYELMGVFSPDLTEPLAEVLAKLGCKQAMVVHGSGLDEITIVGETRVSELKEGHVMTYTIKPTDFGIKMADLSEILGGTAEENAKITMAILEGKEQGPKRDIVLLNAAASLVAAKKAGNIIDGIELAKKSIDSGKALEKLEMLKKFTNNQKGEQK
ncbi:anthranilate phosphoribosyltransferase [Nanoarchaeota archaeon]